MSSLDDIHQYAASKRSQNNNNSLTPVPKTVDPSLSVIDGDVSNGEPLIWLTSFKLRRIHYSASDLLLISTPNTKLSLRNRIHNKNELKRFKNLDIPVPPLNTRSPINPPLSDQLVESNYKIWDPGTHLPFSMKIPTNQWVLKKRLMEYRKKIK